MTTLDVEYTDHMGNDLSVVNAAKVSFDRRSTEIGKPEIDLLRFLAAGLRTKERRELVDELVSCTTREEAGDLIRRIRAIPTHWSPYAHPQVAFRISAPLFVARQLWKHHVGAAGGDVGYPAWNEISRRYVDETPVFHHPGVWRQRAEDVKQGSSPEPVPFQPTSTYDHALRVAGETYTDLLREFDCAPEQARMVLPQAMVTTWMWTGSVAFWARVCTQRLDGHAQDESRYIASLLAEHVHGLFPHSWQALMGEDLWK